MEKVLSLIVPVYNMEKYLRECLESVVLPTRLGEYEVIVVNDGSSDSSLDIANEYEKNFPEIFIVLDKENGGYGSCFNTGIKKAAGKYVKMLDSDDLFDCSLFSQYLDKLTRCNEDIVTNDIIKLDDVTKEKSLMREEHVNDLADLNDLFIHEFSFRRELLAGCECPEHSFYTDNIISMVAFSKASSVCSTCLLLYQYRANRDGQSSDSNQSIAHWQDFCRVSERLISLGPSMASRKKFLFSRHVGYQMYPALRGMVLSGNSQSILAYRKLISAVKKCRVSGYFVLNGVKSKLVRLAIILPLGIGYAVTSFIIHAKDKVGIGR